MNNEVIALLSRGYNRQQVFSFYRRAILQFSRRAVADEGVDAALAFNNKHRKPP